MADYKLKIIDYNNSEVKSGDVNARNRKEAYKSFIESYGSYIDSKTACIEIELKNK